MGQCRSAVLWKRDTSSSTSATFMAPFFPSRSVNESFSTFRPSGVVRRNSGIHGYHRPDAHGGRGLHPRVDPHAGRQDRRRVREHHADLPGAGERGGRARADRLHQVPADHGGEGTVMTTAAAVVAEEPRLHYLNESYGVRSWLLTTDHKRVGLLYLISLTGAFFVGGFFAVMLRLELLTPAGDLLQAETYNKFFTMHGVIMVFFFLVPSIPAVLGNFILPLMIGARDVAFPRLNLLSWYLYVLGASFTTYAVVSGGVDTGWTFYTPYSTMSSTTQVMPTAIGIFIVGFSTILTGLNFIVTIHRMRAPGLTWFRLPLFVWSLYATSLIQILATPVLAITVMLLGLQRLLHVGSFDPALVCDPC